MTMCWEISVVYYFFFWEYDFLSYLSGVKLQYFLYIIGISYSIEDVLGTWNYAFKYIEVHRKHFPLTGWSMTIKLNDSTIYAEIFLKRAYLFWAHQTLVLNSYHFATIEVAKQVMASHKWGGFLWGTDWHNHVMYWRMLTKHLKVEH